MPSFIKFSLTLCALLLLYIAFSSHAYAATFIVNSTADAVDANTADNLCDSDSSTAGLQCTLRAAIEQANVTAGVDTINFTILPGGQQTITVNVCSGLGGLPTTTEAVQIDATTQPTYSGTPLIQVKSDCVNFVSGAGLSFSYSSGATSLVRGLVVSNFDAGIFIQASAGGVQIKGNYIGTDFTGNSSGTGNRNYYGVFIQSSPNNTIGGTTSADRNLISGNTYGVYITGSDAKGNLVQGNYIGTNAAGTADLGNITYGVYVIGAPNNTIGGTASGAGNVISGNDLAGVYLPFSNNTLVQGNKIGTNAAGISGIANVDGVYIKYSNNNTIGGTATGAANTIAFNTQRGVIVSTDTFSGTGHSIRGNSIFSNGNLGIDLGDNGTVEPNDTLDPDKGANNLQNYPVLSYNSTTELVTATLNSTANTTFDIDFYSNTAADATGFGEGQTYLVTRQVTTDASGNATVSTSFPAPVPVGQYVTATATRTVAPLDTSEFSQAVQITGAPTAAESTISGQIISDDGTPLAGTTIILSGTQSRRTITDSQGYYSFNQIETSGFYTVTPQRANYTFSPRERSFSIIGNRTDASFSAEPIAQTENPLDTPEFFVRQHYLDFLNREPDEAGLQYWSQKIRSCGSDEACLRQARIDVSAAFFVEAEFQQTGSFIYRLYKTGLGRRISYSEFTQDRQQIVAGSNLDESKNSFTNAFVQRQEFIQKYSQATTAESFVDALITNIWTASAADLAAERSIMIALYQAGDNINQSRASVIRYVIDEKQFAEVEYNRSFVLAEYFGYLKRDPDEEGYRFWLNILNSTKTNNARAMVCAFITSAEYQLRFSSVISHTNQECAQ